MFAKRLVDLIVALTMLVVCLPLLVLVALSVAIFLGQPVLFSQTRIGRGEKPFTIYKFRSLSNARDAKGDLLPDAQRLTAFGKFLRASSLDELPELWNIITGDMSFVGPRPLLPEYLPYYSQTQQKRHVVRPGLTGLAQVQGRNALSWESRFALDVEYVEKWSMLLDVKILLATVRVVLSRKGVTAPNEATMYRFDEYMKNKNS